MLYSSVTTNA
ncbi:hypothetical protein CGLO_08020 [Colletotrichum gloeosporioides Cg-14]|uniref:Uncharacterized protein n=1 Tax=Colletotrichum gloeosporioides (strain Cg-14) TaxID=1237896 RepID=T0K9X7_COLGC|nr:hypothetical protein CGLO_08020 [Colletotrichum gloeosporioides Cg-14]